MALSVGTKPQVTITDANGKVLQDGDVTTATSVSVHATDGNNGSGLTLLEYWRTPTGTIEPRHQILDDYDLDHTYTLSNLSEGEWNIEILDQAGNDTLHRSNIDHIPFPTVLIS